MTLPLEITFRHMEPSPALESRIRMLVEQLARFSPHILRCHVVVQAPHQHSEQGQLFEFRLDIVLPGHEIAIRRTHPADHAHEEPYVALRDTFRAARRKLQDYERRVRGDTKVAAELPHGRICELNAEQNFGRIETDDGRLIYFHRNSVLGRPFDELATGAEVRFAEEPGDSGPQASTVHVV